MRQLDRPTAAVYQEQQNMFAEEGKAEEFEEGEYEISEQLKQSLAQFDSLYEPAEREITDQEAISLDQYLTVDFSEAHRKIEEIKKEGAIMKAGLAQEGISGGVDKFFLDSQLRIDLLEKHLAYAVLNNLVKLADPIIKSLDNIEKYIKKSLSNNEFVDQEEFNHVLENYVVSRLESVFKGNLFEKLSLRKLVTDSVWQNASKSAEIIEEKLGKLINNFYGYTNDLVKYVMLTDNRSNLRRDRFNSISYAIGTLQKIVNQLYYSTVDRFEKIGLLSDTDFVKFDDTARSKISDLKKNLYVEYRVEQVFDKKNKPVQGYISILSVALMGLAFSVDDARDTLQDIKPSLDDIKKILDQTPNPWTFRGKRKK